MGKRCSPHGDPCKLAHPNAFFLRDTTSLPVQPSSWDLSGFRGLPSGKGAPPMLWTPRQSSTLLEHIKGMTQQLFKESLKNGTDCHIAFTWSNAPTRVVELYSSSSCTLWQARMWSTLQTKNLRSENAPRVDYPSQGLLLIELLWSTHATAITFVMQ